MWSEVVDLDVQRREALRPHLTPSRKIIPLPNRNLPLLTAAAATLRKFKSRRR